MYLIEDFAKGFEINYGRCLFSQESWESTFNYPEIGLGLYYGTFGNNKIYGSGIALFPYVNHNIYRSSHFSVQNKVSFGLGYATKAYCQNNNPYNSIFSTHLNIYIGLALLMDYRISDRLSVDLSASLTHLSNGAMRKPNNGINTVTASIGTKYHFNTDRTPVLKRTKPLKSNQKEILVVGSIGRSQSTRYNNQHYWNANLNITHLWHINSKRAIGIGYDQIYAESIPYAWLDDSIDDHSVHFTSSDNLVSGLFASYNVFLGQTTLYVNIGAYLQTNIEPPHPIYPRIGIRHDITQKIVANFSVKASFFRSEFLEFGLGYRINYKNKNND